MKLRILLVAWVAVTLLMVFVHLRLLPYAHDDAYIHIRIANNLATVGVPYFNVNEPVKVTSSTAWTILLATLFRFTGSYAVVIAVMNALFTTTGAYIFTDILRRVTNKTSSQFIYWVFFWSYISAVIVPSIGLMETSFALLVVGLSLRLLLAKNKLCCALWGLMVFIRLELAVLVAVLVVFSMVKKAFPLRTLILYTMLTLLPLLAFDLYFFKSPIPNTVIAKAKIYILSTQDAFNKIIEFSIPNSKILQQVPEGRNLLFIFVFIALAVEIIYKLRKRNWTDRNDLLTFSLFLSGVTIAVAYTLKQVFVTDWYTPLIVIPFLFFAFRTFILRLSPRIAVLAPPAFLIFLLIGLGQTVYAGLFKPTFSPIAEVGARVRKYMQVGDMLHQFFPDQALMTSEIGGLGYGFKGYIYDGAGLASPDALKYHPMAVPQERSDPGIGAIPVGYIREKNPELIVSYDIFVEAFFYSDLLKYYYHAADPVYLPEDLTIKTYLWNSHFLNIFVRKDMLTQAVRFGDTFELTLPKLNAQRAARGTSLNINLLWHTLRQPALDYSVVVFLLNDQGQVAAQHDASPGNKPTSAWAVDDLSFDNHPINLNVPSGHYTIGVKVYWYGDLKALPVNNRDYLIIGTLDVD